MMRGMSDFRISQIETPISVTSGTRVWLELLWRDYSISSIYFTTKENPLASDSLPEKWFEVFKRYWERPLDRLTQSALAGLPVDLGGTPYQQRVWSALRLIPCGRTVSYGAISDRLQSSPRAVAAACRVNPVVLAVPCHRVVSKSGLGGFMGELAGDSIDIKQWLNDHER